MDVPEWKDEYRIDGSIIDAQHKKLFLILKELHDALEQDQDQLILNSIMKELADYSSYHFSSEEEFMESIHYPELEKQRNEHIEFIGEVFEGLTQFAERSGVAANDLFVFLNNWIVNHILASDLKIKNFIK